MYRRGLAYVLACVCVCFASCVFARIACLRVSCLRVRVFCVGLFACSRVSVLFYVLRVCVFAWLRVCVGACFV